MPIDSDKLKKWAPLGAAGALGLAAAGLGWTLVASGPGSAGASEADHDPIDLEDVVIAARALPAGTAIDAGDLTTMRVVAGGRAQSAYGRVGDLTDGERPRVTAAFVAAGQPVMFEHLAPEGEEAGLAAALDRGYRAITLKTDVYTGLAGFLKPESRVDVVATIRGEGQPYVRTIVQDVRVLAVNGRMAGQEFVTSDEQQLSDEGPADSVTLMVTPEQAGRLELAVGNGSPRLVLRSGVDRELSAFEGMTLADLRGTGGGLPEAERDPWDADEDEETFEPTGIAGLDATPAGEPVVADPVDRPTTRPTTPAEPKHVVEVIRGGVTSRETVGDGDAPAADPFE